MDHNLVNILEQNKFVFLVGAGISLDNPSNLLSSFEFINLIIDKIAPNEEYNRLLKDYCWAENPKRANKGDFLRFESIMQILHSTVDENLDVLNYMNNCSIPNINHYIFASLIKKGHKVLTTNFDTLIEFACIELNITTTAIITDEDFNNHEDVINPLYKLHGSFKKYVNNNWIDTKDSIQATIVKVGKEEIDFTHNLGKRVSLSNLLQRHDLIIIGYSGYDDFDICPLLSSIKSDKKIIWINHLAKGSNEKKYLWNDIKEAKRDKNGDFVERRHEYLYTMGANGVRKQENILLYNMDSNEVMHMLTKIHNISLPPHKSPYHFDKYEYFNNWEQQHVQIDALKYFICSKLLNSISKFEEANHLWEKSLSVFEKDDNQAGVSLCLRYMGTIHQRKGEYVRALEKFNKALQIDQKLGNKGGICNALYYIAMVNRDMGRIIEALNQYNICLQISAELGDKFSMANCLGEIGSIHDLHGDYNKAIYNYNKALKIEEELGDKHGISTTLHAIGIIHHKKGDYDKAFENYDKSLQIAQMIGYEPGISKSFHQIGNYHYSKGDHNKALTYYTRSIQIKEKLADKSGICHSLNGIGVIHSRKHDYQKALEAFNKSLRISQELGNKSSMSYSLFQIGNIHYAEGDYDKALGNFNRSLVIRQELNDLSGIANTSGGLGLLYGTMGNSTFALKYICIAKVFFEFLQSPYSNQYDDKLEILKHYVHDSKIRDAFKQAKKLLHKYVVLEN